MIYDRLFEISESALNPFEMTYDFRFEMSAQIFVQRSLFVRKYFSNSRDEKSPAEAGQELYFGFGNPFIPAGIGFNLFFNLFVIRIAPKGPIFGQVLNKFLRIFSLEFHI